MSDLIIGPEALASTAADVERIGSAIGAAGADAVGPTTGVAAAAQDEVSAAIAKLFSAYGQEYQALIAQAGAFHTQFGQTLSAAGSSYAQAEATAAALLENGLGSPAQALLGQNPFSAAPTGGSPFGGFAALTPTLTSPVTALIMGGAHNPGPDPLYLSAVNTAYIQRLFPGANHVGLPTPEQFWPATPELGNTLTFGQSVSQGVGLLDSAIKTNLASSSVAVFGYSESATIATREIQALMASATPPPADKLAFVLIGNPNNPDGGLLARFPGFYIPGLDVPFNGATPQSPWQTDVYTIQYDGFADFPQYPLNVLSDLNAIMGISLHSDYPWLTPAQLDAAVPLPTASPNDHYYMLLTQNLPLLQPIRDIPTLGPPIADLLQPDARVLVDLGYSGYGPGIYADVPTPAGLFNVPNPFTVFPALGTGAVQGVQGALVDVGVLPQSYLPNTYPYVPSIDPNLNVNFGQPSTTLLSILSGGTGSVLQLIPPPNLSGTL